MVFSFVLIIFLFYLYSGLTQDIRKLEKKVDSLLKNYNKDKNIVCTESLEQKALPACPMAETTESLSEKTTDIPLKTTEIPPNEIDNEPILETAPEITENVATENIMVENLSTESSDERDENSDAIINENNDKNSTDTLSFLGQKLITWIAGFAAILGAFYLVKYSIEMGLIGPKVRLFLATLFGFGAIKFGYNLFFKKDFANNERISQALIGSGFSALYFVAYAIAKMYHYVPESLSFIFMCGITAGIVILTIKTKGQAITILGLIGGFMTPLMVSAKYDNAAFLSLYLIVFSMVFLCLAKYFSSILIVIATLFGTYIWIFARGFLAYHYFDSVWFILLNLCIITTIFKLFDDDKTPNFNAIKIVSLIFCFIFASSFLVTANYGLLEWGVVLSSLLGLVLLAIWNKKDYFPIFVSGFVLSFVLLVNWKTHNLLNKQVVSFLISLIGILPFYITIWYKQNTLFTRFVCLSAPLVYIFNYLLFKESTYIPHIGLSMAVILMLPIIKLKYEEDKTAIEYLLLSSFGLASMALASLLHMDFWIIALSIEILLVSIISKSAKFKKIPLSLTILIGLFIVLQLKHIAFVILLLVFERMPDSIPVLNMLSMPAFISHIVFPVFSFALLYLLTEQKIIKMFAKIVCLSLTFLGLVLAYILFKINFIGLGSLALNFLEHAVITDILLLSFIGKKYSKTKTICTYLFRLGAFRLFIAGLFFASPFFSLINTSFLSIIIAYGIPMGLFYFISIRSAGDEKKIFAWGYLIMSFVFISAILLQTLANTVFLFGIYLNSSSIFTLSFVWLALGCLWLAISFKMKDRNLVNPAFTLIYFVIFKVFLFDLSSLTGILRVITLFGLALSLLGISHFYTKFFKQKA